MYRKLSDEMNYIAVVFSYRHKKTGAVGEDFLILRDELGLESLPIVTEDSVYPGLLDQNLMKAGKYLMKAKGFTDISYIASARCGTEEQANEYLEKIRKLKEKTKDFYNHPGYFTLEEDIEREEFLAELDAFWVKVGLVSKN